MNNQLRPLALAIVLVGALIYLGGIVYAGIAGLQSAQQPTIPPIVVQFVTAIGAALGTFFGAIFGISQYVNGNGPKPNLLQIQVWAKPLPSVNARGAATPPPEALTQAQIVAAYLYFGSLVLALLFWLLDGFFSANAAEIIKNMTYSLVGVIVGVLGIVLNVRQS